MAKWNVVCYDPLADESWVVEVCNDEIRARSRAFELYTEGKSRYYNIPEELRSFKAERVVEDDATRP